MQLPDEFINWIYKGRAQLVKNQLEGKMLEPAKMFLGFTRHTPTVISHGPAGLNGSVKGVGFIPKPEYIEEVLKDYMEHINAGWREGYSTEGLKLLVKHIYGEGCADRIDFTKLVSLELAMKHSWENIKSNGEATLLFYQPPVVSYEVRCRVEIHTSGLIHKYTNAQHDVFHKPNVERWPQRPAYLFHILEIYDNSNTGTGFGRKIYPL